MDLREKDLRALDHYEGYPHFCRKEILDVEPKGKTVPAYGEEFNAWVNGLPLSDTPFVGNDFPSCPCW